jgi:7,8-dihydropterin-6-yl-methyl-4-(beta-D-ribofuranosyl)aminobenzene 5'-phosphate synthase
MKNITSLIVICLVIFVGSIIEPVKGAEQISITILYDNTVHTPGMEVGWGFACLIQGTEKTILFDTGWQSQILLGNIDFLGVNLDSLDLIVISHNHPDHTGGLDSALGRNSEVSVYFGTSFPSFFGQNISNRGATPILVDEPIEICEHVYSTGELHGDVYEQSLIIDTEKGLVIITGCSHPGIVYILNKAKELHNKNIYLVMGGFHLLNFSVPAVNQIIEDFQALGVEKCGATHCTGEIQIALFEAAYGENYVPMGVGQIIQVQSIPTDIKESEVGESQIPQRFKLEQNYPNPFNPTTTIKYSVPKLSFVTIKIYDVLGNEVATLVNEEKAVGAYELNWNATNLPSGVYFYRLQAGDFVETKKMILLK